MNGEPEPEEARGCPHRTDELGRPLGRPGSYDDGSRMGSFLAQSMDQVPQIPTAYIWADVGETARAGSIVYMPAFAIDGSPFRVDVEHVNVGQLEEAKIIKSQCYGDYFLFRRIRVNRKRNKALSKKTDDEFEAECALAIAKVQAHNSMRLSHMRTAHASITHGCKHLTMLMLSGRVGPMLLPVDGQEWYEVSMHARHNVPLLMFVCELLAIARGRVPPLCCSRSHGEHRAHSVEGVQRQVAGNYLYRAWAPCGHDAGTPQVYQLH